MSVDQYRCYYCDNPHLAHPIWLYMTTDKRYNPLDTKNPQPSPALICRSKHPPSDLKTLNRVKGHQTGSKASKAGSPYHQIECTAGPFYGRGVSKELKRYIHSGARKVTTRLLQMKKVAMLYNVTLYARDIKVFEALSIENKVN